MPNKSGLLLTIATCVLDARQDFLATANSLPDILPDWIEWIVIDGGSTDGTREAIAADSRVTRFVSEKDAGVYYAYNRALSLAVGRHVWFLNAGDTAIASTLISLGSVLLTAMSEASPPVFCHHVHMEQGNWDWKPAPEQLLDEMSVPTPGMLIPRDALLAIRGFDTAYRIAADYDAWMRLRMVGTIRFAVCELVLANYKGGGMSTTHRHLAFFEECVSQLRADRDRWAYCLFRAARRAVFNIDPDSIRFRRWRLAFKLGRKFLY